MGIKIMMIKKDIYQDILLEHYRNPRCTKALERSDFSSGLFNPSCGDQILVQGVVLQGSLHNASFSGKGCVISQASSSLLLNHAIGMKLNDILQFSNNDVQDLIGMQLGPLRIGCALLSLRALQAGIRDYLLKKV